MKKFFLSKSSHFKISDLENERSSLKEKVSNLESKSMDTAAPAETAPAVETPAAVAEEGTTESAPEPAKEPEKKPGMSCLRVY